MKASEIEVGGIYTAKVSGRICHVRVESFRIRWKPSRPGSTRGREWAEYVCKNLETRREIVVRSCQRFRSVVKTLAQVKADEEANARVIEKVREQNALLLKVPLDVKGSVADRLAWLKAHEENQHG